MFSLATIRRNGVACPVIEVADRFYDLREVAPALLGSDAGLISLFRDWPHSEDSLMALAATVGHSYHAALPTPETPDILTPLMFPPKLILGGANYYEHMFKDAKKPDFRKEDAIPVFFLKPPSTSLVGCGPTVRYPVQSQKFDWEIELAVVIGRKLRRASKEEALAAVAAYAVGIDLSARDWQMNPRHPWRFDLFTGKAFDDSCPVGPKLVPARFVDPTNLRLQLRVNGELKQDANSSDMIWSVGEQISVLSEHLTLEPGDMLLTGTPAGVGMASGTYLEVGDRIEAEITGLGRLSVEITPDVASPRTPRAG